MITRFRIENFRRFRELVIEELCPVNLLVGANNVGKSTLLEALELYTYAPNCTASLVQLLVERQEVARPLVPEGLSDEGRGPGTVFAHLFHRGSTASVLKLEGTRDGDLEPKALTIRTGWAIASEEDRGNRQSLSFVEVLTEQTNDHKTQPSQALSVTFGGVSDFDIIERLARNMDHLRRFQREIRIGRSSSVGIEDLRNSPLSPCVRVPSGEMKDADLEKLWRFVVYQNWEDEVVEALRLIEPDVQKVFFIEDVPFVRRSAEHGAVVEPLRALGDGMVRLFQISVALHAAGHGQLLLLDEVDRGLYFDALPRFWHYLFTLSKRLGVQIVATTHSADCIRAFARAAQMNTDVAGQILRLDSVGRETLVTTYDESMLGVVYDQKVEVR